MSKAGQSNIRGINAQVRAAMSLYLQHMGDSKFSHIQLEEPRLGDFFLVFNDGHKIICEVKDRKVRFSYADLRSLVRSIIGKKILKDNDEILIICKNLDKRLKDSVHNIKYFKDSKITKVKLLIKASELMKLKPLGDRVVVKPVTQEEVTKSGIVLPDTVEKEKKEQGER